MIAGPNGSGKSTLIARLKAAGIAFGEYLNADEIAAKMTGPSEAVALAAQVQVRERRQLAVKEGRDHSFETVLSHPSHIDHLRLAREAGFQIIVYFVATNGPAINIGRVKNRVLHGGHDVPLDRIKSRYLRSIANLTLAIDVAHEGAVFDNSSVQTPMILLATLGGGEITPQVPVASGPMWWREFMQRWQNHRSRGQS